MPEQRKPFHMMTAGPVNVSDTVKQSLIYPEMGHREPEFEMSYGELRGNLLKAFNVSARNYASVVINGSGTSAGETIISSMIHPGKKMLVVNNGAFGDRLAEICDVYRIPHLKTDYTWGEYPDIGGIEKILMQETDIEAVSMVFMETSTGMVNPVKEVGELCGKYGKMFVVDAVSGFAGDPLNLEESKIDFCFSNDNKCIGGLPVISFVLANWRAAYRIKDVQPRNYSLDLLKHIKYAEHGNQTPFTPQIPLFLMLNQAIKELLEEGIDNRIARYRANSQLMRQRLSSLGLKFQLPEEHMSNVMTNVLIPGNYRYEEFHAPLKEKGYIIYPGKGPLDGKVLHIANVGTQTVREVGKFCDAVEEITKEKRAEY
jgi:2-aminoethylphosphonate-pyruvate transaminase